MVKVTTGKIWIWITVIRTYYGIIMSTVMVIGVLRLLKWEWWLIALMMVGIIFTMFAVLWIHMRYVYPSFLEENWRKNPEFKKLKRKVNANKA